MMLTPKVGAHSRRRARRRSPSTGANASRPLSPRPSRLLAAARAPVSAVRWLTRLRPSMLRTLSLRSLHVAPGGRRGRRRSAARGRPLDGRPTGRRRPRQTPFERRRARVLLLAAAVFAFVVVFVTLPWSVLASQHHQLSSDSSQVKDLQAENRALSAQARQLADPAAVAGLAREDYGLVRPGQRAYDILPAAGTHSSTVTDAGHVPLNQAPVVPGSRRSQELLGAGVGAGVAPAPATTTSGANQDEKSLSSGDATPGTKETSGGFWSRVGHTLAFWS